MTEEIITKLQAFLQEVKTEDYIKIKYEDLTETLEEAIKLIQTLLKESEKLNASLDEISNINFPIIY